VDATLLEFLASAGATSLLVIAATAFSLAIVRGWLVAGSHYKRETDRADKATLQTERTIEALARNTELMEQVRDELRRLGERRDAR
jgi:hypothetical protein